MLAHPGASHGMYVQLTWVVNGLYVQQMSQTSSRFEMRAPNDWLVKVDEWRRQQPDIPSRAEAIRRLVDLALSEQEAASKSSPPPSSRRP